MVRKLLEHAPAFGRRDGVLEVLAKTLVASGRAEEAYKTVEQIGSPGVRSHAALEMACVLAEQGAEAPFGALQRRVALGRENARRLDDADRPASRVPERKLPGAGHLHRGSGQGSDSASRVWQAIGMRAAKTDNRDDAKWAFEQSRVAANRLEELEFRLRAPE